MVSASNLKVWAALVVAAVSTAIAVAVIVVALDAGTAVAATPTRATIEATVFQVEPTRVGEAFAKCPGTKRAVGGGVVQSGAASNELKVVASGPLDETGVTANTITGDIATQWYAAVRNSSTDSRVFKVFAICSDASDATIVATPMLTVDSLQVDEAFAKCPGTKRAVGGGVVQSGAASSGLGVVVSGPLDETGVTSETITGDIAKQWYAAVRNGSPGQLNYKVFAICSGDSSAKIKASAFTVLDRQTGEAYAKCGRTKRALGGGVVQSGPASEGLALVASGPLDRSGVTLDTNDGDIAKKWYAAVSNFSGGPREYKVFAICE